MKGSIRSTVAGLALVLGGSLMVASGGALAQAQSSSRGSASFTANLSSINFGTVDVGTSRQVQVIVTNSGTANGSVSATTTNPQYRVSGCAESLGIRRTCFLTVTFTPRSDGPVPSATLNIVRGPNVNLTGTGRGVAKLAVTPSRLELRCSPPKRGPDVGTVRVANVGSATLKNIAASVLSGPFTLSPSTCADIQVGGSACLVTVTYTPVSKTPTSRTLTIVSNGGTERVAVSGSCPRFASP